MFKELKNFIYNNKEKRFRGSFVTVLSTFFIYLAYVLILFLVYHEVYIHEKNLSDLSTLVLGTFASISGVQTFGANSYFRNKSRQNRYAKTDIIETTETTEV